MSEAPEQQGESGRRLPPEEHRWKPGQSGNPGGRPKGLPSLKKALIRHLSEGMDEEGVGPLVQNLVQAVVRKALEGDVKAIALLWDRVDGPVPRDLNLGVQQGTQVTIKGVRISNPPPMPEEPK